MPPDQIDADPAMPSEDARRPDGQLDPERVREIAIEEEPKHHRVLQSAADGRRLSAAMLPFFLLRPPSGFGVIATTGRRSGKQRRKCVRVIRVGDVAYLVALRPPAVAIAKPSLVNAWVWNIRANPEVSLRIRGGTFKGLARELTTPAEIAQARTALCGALNPFDTAECAMHLRGRPTRAKIEDLHAYGSTPASRLRSTSPSPKDRGGRIESRSSQRERRRSG